MGKRHSKEIPRNTQEASIPVFAYPTNRVGNFWSKADVEGPDHDIFEQLRVVQATRIAFKTSAWMTLNLAGG